MAAKGGGDRKQSERIKGHVKWFNDQKGFGFITPKVGGEDLFVQGGNHGGDGRGGGGGYGYSGCGEVVAMVELVMEAGVMEVAVAIMEALATDAVAVVMDVSIVASLAIWLETTTRVMAAEANMAVVETTATNTGKRAICSRLPKQQ